MRANLVLLMPCKILRSRFVYERVCLMGNSAEIELQSTNKRSALGTIREAELYGGVLSTSLSREHLALTAEFLRGDE